MCLQVPQGPEVTQEPQGRREARALQDSQASQVILLLFFSFVLMCALTYCGNWTRLQHVSDVSCLKCSNGCPSLSEHLCECRSDWDHRPQGNNRPHR